MAGHKVTVPEIVRMKEEGRRITCLTAYDYPFARILDDAGVDIILVGDSAGMVVAGRPDTLSVTLEEMIYHTRAVASGARRALVVADMPFLSYQVSVAEAKRNAGRLVQEGRAEAVKLEGGVNQRETIRAIVAMEIPVMGHIGLTPQSIHRMGGYKVQGKRREEQERIVADAVAVEEAGAFSLVLEGIPEALARQITGLVRIPTIGIGAGVHCDGQVLVLHDALGLQDAFRPKFVKQYANLWAEATDAVKSFIEEVRSGTFPGDEHTFH